MFKTEKKATKISNYTTDALQSLKVLYDGNCAMCIAMVHHFSKVTSAVEVEWNAVIPATPQERADLRFQIFDNEGNEYFNTDARLILLKAYPRYRRIGCLLSHQYLRWIIDPVFSFIASNRYRISNMIAFFGVTKRNGAVESSNCDGNCNYLNHKRK